MKLPVKHNNAFHDRNDNSFDFGSQLRFEAEANLLRSRSDTLIRYGKSHHGHAGKSTENYSDDIWSVPAIDFSLHRHQTKPMTKMKPNSNVRRRKQRREDQHYVREALPKLLEKPQEKATPFVTTFRLQSAGTAKRLFVKEGVYQPGCYTNRPIGPHVFRGYDFRPDLKETLKGKPPFITIFRTDPGNLELKRKSAVSSLPATMANGQEKPFDAKPFVTSTDQKSKFEPRLVLAKERYVRGMSEDEIRMNQIISDLSWCPRKEKITSLYRPDIKDHKTLDWLRVTRHPTNENTILH